MRTILIRSVFVIVILVALFSAACTGAQKPAPESKSEEPVQEDPPLKESAAKEEPSGTLADYFPLTKGSTWQYLGKGNEYASFKRKVLFTQGKKAQIREDSGGTVSASVFEVTDTAITRIFFQGESYENKNFLDREPNDNLVILQKPLKVGTKWSTNDVTREIVDINATVTTPAGTFKKCLKVKISYPNSTLYEYFKEGVGMVQREFISGDTTITSVLEKYVIE